MSRISTRSKILIGVGLALAIQGANGFFAFQSTTEYIDAAAQRRESSLMLQKTTEFLSLLTDAETGQRGYLLTGNAEFLEPYDRAVPEIPRAFAELRTGGGERLAAEMAAIAPLLDRKLAEMRRTIELYRDPQQGPAAAAAMVAAGDARRDMSQIRGSLLDIERREQQRLDEFVAVTDRLSGTTLISVLLVGSLAMVLVALAGWLVYRDLKARVRIEDQLREQKSILQSVLDSMADAVIVADAAGRLTLFNAAAERMHGPKPDGVASGGWSGYFGLYLTDGETPYPTDNLPLVRVLRGENVDHAELYLRPRGGGDGSFQDVSGRPIHDEHGTFRGGAIVSRDVTQQKLAEREIRRINEELEDRVRRRTLELASTNAELLQKNQENEMFVYSVSHDLRSPLVNLQGFSRELTMACDQLRTLLSDAAVPASIREQSAAVLDDDVATSVQFIQSAVVRLAGIINALLRLSRAGRVEYQFQNVPLRAVVERIVEAQHSILSKIGAEVVVEPLPDVWGDPTAVEQMFANVLENAAKYLDPARPGRITIGEATADDSAPDDAATNCRTLFVRDNGLGIPAVAQAKIFNAFERCHTDVAPGDGMGLAIVSRIVHRHGGKIWVRSVEGEGTCFYISLPCGTGDQASSVNAAGATQS